MCGGRRRSGTERVAIGVVRQRADEHAERHLERLRGINPLAIRLDLGDDQVLRFGSNDVQRPVSRPDMVLPSIVADGAGITSLPVRFGVRRKR